MKKSEQLPDSQLKVKQLDLQDILGEQGFHYAASDFFEAITKILEDTSQNLLEEAEATIKALGDDFIKNVFLMISPGARIAEEASKVLTDQQPILSCATGRAEKFCENNNANEKKIYVHFKIYNSNN